MGCHGAWAQPPALQDPPQALDQQAPVVLGLNSLPPEEKIEYLKRIRSESIKYFDDKITEVHRQNGIPISLPNAGLLESPTFLGRMTQMIMQMSPGPARKHLNRGVVPTRTCVSPAASLDEPIGPNAYSLIPKPLHRRLAQAWHPSVPHPVAAFRNNCGLR